MISLSDPGVVKSQYKDASRLNARIQLHKQFSTNKQGWFRWRMIWSLQKPNRWLPMCVRW